jgi:hypothetical protein
VTIGWPRSLLKSFTKGLAKLGKRDVIRAVANASGEDGHGAGDATFTGERPKV